MGEVTGIRIELADCTRVLCEEAQNREITQASIALTYALALRSGEKTDWEKVNGEILKRWRFSGLERIKRMAWKRLQKAG